MKINQTQDSSKSPSMPFSVYRGMVEAILKTKGWCTNLPQNWEITYYFCADYTPQQCADQLYQEICK